MSTTTKLTTTNGTAPCRVEYDFDLLWVRLTSVLSGKTLTLEMETRSVNDFSPEHRKLWHKLVDGHNGVVYQLTVQEMKLFKEMVEGTSSTMPTIPLIPPMPVIAPTTPTTTPVVAEVKAPTMAERNNALLRSLPVRRVIDPSLPGGAERLTSLTQHLKTLNLRRISYDIPDESNVGNPSRQLWLHGAVRASKSDWIAPARALNSGLASIVTSLENMCAVYPSARFRVHKIHESDLADYVRDLNYEIDGEIRRLHTSLIENIDSADRKLHEIEATENATPKIREDAQKARDGKVRTIIAHAGAALNALIARAEEYDMTMELNDLLEALRQSVRTQAEIFNAAARVKQIKLAPMV